MYNSEGASLLQSIMCNFSGTRRWSLDRMLPWGYVLFGLLLLHASCRPGPEPETEWEIYRGSAPETMSIQSTDTATINKLLLVAYPLIYQHTDSAISLYRQIMSLSRQIDYFQGVAASYNNLAFCYLGKNDFAKANAYYTEGVVYLKEAIQKTNLLRQPRVSRDLYPYLLSFYNQLNAYDEVIRVYHRASPYYSISDSTQHAQLSKMKLDLAAAYFLLGQYDSASNIYLSILPAINLPNKKNYTLLVFSYFGLGGIESRMGLQEKAIAYFQEAKLLAQQFQDTAMYLNALNNIGTHYMEHRDFKQAKKYAQEALALANNTSSSYNKHFSLSKSAFTMAASMMQEEQPEEALVYSKMVQDFANSSGNKKDQISAGYLIGANLIRLNRPRQAIKYLKASLSASLDLKESDFIIGSYEQLGEAYAAAGDYESAYRLKSRHIRLKDSVRGTESAVRIKEINNKYKLAEKDKLLAQNKLVIANQQIKIKNQYMLVGIVGASALSIILMLILILRKRQHRVEVERLKARIAGEEQERSRMAMELHDGIISRLSIIKTNLCTLPQPSHLPEEQDALQEAIAQLDQGIAELRTTSHNLLPEILKQAGLAGTLDSYCQKIKQTGKLDIDFQMVGNLPPLKDDFQLNIYRIIQELVNNILKHAGATTALIQFAVRASKLEITIDDNGICAYTGEINTDPGIGMHNLQSRLQLLGGSMETERNEGTSVYLNFDLKQHIVPAP